MITVRPPVSLWGLQLAGGAVPFRAAAQLPSKTMTRSQRLKAAGQRRTERTGERPLVLKVHHCPPGRLSTELSPLAVTDGNVGNEHYRVRRCNSNGTMTVLGSPVRELQPRPGPQSSQSRRFRAHPGTGAHQRPPRWHRVLLWWPLVD